MSPIEKKSLDIKYENLLKKLRKVEKHLYELLYRASVHENWELVSNLNTKIDNNRSRIVLLQNTKSTIEYLDKK